MSPILTPEIVVYDVFKFYAKNPSNMAHEPAIPKCNNNT